MIDRPGNINVFILYATADEALKNELENHLSLLQHHGYIDVWHEGQIDPGAERTKVISECIEKAHIILLLISANFLAPDCYSKYEPELRMAYARQQRGEVKIIPVILRHCIWQLDMLASLNPLPQGGHPVRSKHWETPDLAFQNIVLALQQTAKDLMQAAQRVQQDAPPAPPTKSPLETPVDEAPRSLVNEPSSDPDSAAEQLINDLFELLTQADRASTEARIVDLMHPSLLRNGALEPTFRKNKLDRACERLSLYNRPVQILARKPTGRTRLGALNNKEEGEEVSYTVTRNEDLGGLPGHVRIFFPKQGGAPSISSISL